MSPELQSHYPYAWAALFVAWIVALAASLGALFIGEIMGQYPCELCWFQRVFMFPLAIILGIAAFRSDRGVTPYALTLAGAGWVVSLYHALLYFGFVPEKNPAMRFRAFLFGQRDDAFWQHPDPASFAVRLYCHRLFPRPRISENSIMNRRFGVILTGLLAIGAFTAGAAIYGRTYAEEPAAKVATVQADVFVRAHSPIIGPKTAPVTIVEFFDPSCEACRAFYPGVKQILAAYPNDVRLVLRYLPLHQGSAEAIGILEAARAQGVLEPVMSALLEAQPAWHDGNMAGAWVAAEAAGLDVEKAKAMPMTGAKAVMEADMADANSLAVKGTPSFFVNGKPLAEFGPEQLYAQVRAEVEALRSATQQ